MNTNKQAHIAAKMSLHYASHARGHRPQHPQAPLGNPYPTGEEAYALAKITPQLGLAILNNDPELFALTLDDAMRTIDLLSIVETLANTIVTLELAYANEHHPNDNHHEKVHTWFTQHLAELNTTQPT